MSTSTVVSSVLTGSAVLVAAVTTQLLGARLEARRAAREDERRAEDRADSLRREDAERSASRHRELKAQVDLLIRAAQLAEEAASHHPDDAALKGHAASEMWVAYKSLSVMVDGPLRDAAAQYCDELNACLWEPDERAPWVRVRDVQGRFLGEATETTRALD